MCSNMSPMETLSNYFLNYYDFHSYRGIVTEQVTTLMTKFPEFKPFHENMGKLLIIV